MTSMRKRLPSGHRSAVRRKCRQHNSSTEKKNRFARSARTRRSVRSRRVELCGEFAREKSKIGKYGVVGKMHLVQCRADSVKHATSPSRRDMSQRAIMSPVIQLQSASAEHRDVRRRYAAYLSPFVQSGSTRFNPSAGSAFPASCLGPVPSFPRLKRMSRSGKFRHRTAVLILL